MEIFNIGPFELLIILVIMFVLLGPDEMKRTARRIAISVRKFLHSPLWEEITGMKEEILELPKRLVEDTGLGEAYDDIKQTTTAVTDETNAAMKESLEAARVHEVEHAKVLTAQNVSPKAGQVIMPPRQPKPAAASQSPAESTGESGEAGEPTDDSEDPASLAAAAHAYALEVDIEPSEHEPAQDKPISETVNTIAPPAEVVEKNRGKKGEGVEAPNGDEEAPAKKPAPKARRKVETDPQATAPGKNGSAAENPTIQKDETNEPNAA